MLRATSRWRCWRDPCARRAEGKALRRWRAGRRDLSEGPPLAMGRRASARRPPRPPVRRRNPAADRARRVEATPSSIPSPKARAPRAPRRRRRRRPVTNARRTPPHPRKSRRDGETAIPAGAGPGAGADPGAGAVGAAPIPGDPPSGTPSSGPGRRWSAAWKMDRFASASCASARGDGTRRTSPWTACRTTSSSTASTRRTERWTATWWCSRSTRWSTGRRWRKARKKKKKRPRARMARARAGGPSRGRGNAKRAPPRRRRRRRETSRTRLS